MRIRITSSDKWSHRRISLKRQWLWRIVHEEIAAFIRVEIGRCALILMRSGLNIAGRDKEQTT
jgi:hypothetical protein